MYSPTLLILHEFIRNESEKYRGQEHLLEGVIRQFGRKLGHKIMIKLQMDKDPMEFKTDPYNQLRMFSTDFWVFIFNKLPEETLRDQKMFRLKDRDFEFFGRIDSEQLAVPENQKFLENCQLLAKSLVEGACLCYESKVELDFWWNGEMWVFDLKLI